MGLQGGRLGAGGNPPHAGPELRGERRASADAAEGERWICDTRCPCMKDVCMDVCMNVCVCLYVASGTLSCRSLSLSSSVRPSSPLFLFFDFTLLCMFARVSPLSTSGDKFSVTPTISRLWMFVRVFCFPAHV